MHAIESFSALKKKKTFCPFANIDGPGGHYAKWDKPTTEEQIQLIPLMWFTLNSQTHRNRLAGTRIRKNE
jgi:hypothetical protein